MASREAREIKCDRLRPGGSDSWHWRRADVANRCFTHCDLEGERSWALAQRQRGRERRILSVFRQFDRGRRRGGNLRDSTRRFSSRQGSHRGRRRTKNGDDLYRR